jgi:hypothetical protein
MNESESEKALNLRIREYWARAYNNDNKNKNDNRFSIYDIGSIDLV